MRTPEPFRLPHPRRPRRRFHVRPVARRLAAATLVLALGALPLSAVQRFPRPDFASGYEPPALAVPAPRAPIWDLLDGALLAVALGLAAHLALRSRSRRGLVGLAFFSLLYFGFARRGCICAVGAIQNLALGWADPAYAIPLSAVVFFALPLLAALFFGRVFCAAVCPLGALQELVLWRPLRLPAWLNHTLSLLPWGFLGIALLFAATGAGFPICRWDPFVGLFRLGAPVSMALLGGGVLVLGLVVGRPYCRFVCPYGALLGLCSRVARRHATITPERCVQCRLCEEACPYGAIRRPQPSAAPEPRRTGARRLALIFVAAPAVVLAAGATGFASGVLLSHAHPRVKLALELHRPPAGSAPRNMTLEWETFLLSGETDDALSTGARRLQRRFAAGGALYGILLAAALCAKLTGLSIWRSRTDYEPDRALCFSCGRCFAYCPVGRKPRRTPSPP